MAYPRIVNGTIDLGAYEAQFACPAGSAIFVDASASGNNDGSTWADAFTDLQDALARVETGVCSSVDAIRVAQSTYTPGTTRSDTFQLVNSIAIYGGFAGSETALSQRDPAAHHQPPPVHHHRPAAPQQSGRGYCLCPSQTGAGRLACPTRRRTLMIRNPSSGSPCPSVAHHATEGHGLFAQYVS
jgi:hypothetical protein